MSDATYENRLNLAEQVARIERMQEETRKFVAERDKLLAEAGKFNRERWLIWTAGLGGIAGLIAAVATIARAVGGS